jgi:phage head maturation protease
MFSPVVCDAVTAASVVFEPIVNGTWAPGGTGRLVSATAARLVEVPIVTKPAVGIVALELTVPAFRNALPVGLKLAIAIS